MARRFTLEDVANKLEEIKKAVADDDYELAHYHQDALMKAVVEKLAANGSRLAKAALAAYEIEFHQRMA